MCHTHLSKVGVVCRQQRHKQVDAPEVPDAVLDHNVAGGQQAEGSGRGSLRGMSKQEDSAGVRCAWVGVWAA